MTILRVMHVITGLNTGGAEMMLYKLLSAMDNRRFETSVVSLMDRGPLAERIEALGVPVWTLGLTRPEHTLTAPAIAAELVSLRPLRRLSRHLRQQRPDLVQGWMYHGNLAATLATVPLSGVSVLWNIRHSVHRLRDEKVTTAALIRLSPWLMRRVKRVIYNSRVSARQHQLLGYRAERTEVIPNGFDLRRFRPDPERGAALRRRLNIPADAALIGLVARYHPLKNHAGLLRAAGRIATARPQAQFLLAGREVTLDNPALARLIAEHNLSGRAQLLGERRDVPALLAALDIFCLPSSSEGFPNAVGEAMACGVPCVVTDVGDTAWLVGDTGLTVPVSSSPTALTDALLAMLDRGAARRRELGAAARARIEAHFSLPRIADRYQTLYQTVANEAG